MAVTGAAQLLTAPLAAFAETQSTRNCWRSSVLRCSARVYSRTGLQLPNRFRRPFLAAGSTGRQPSSLSVAGDRLALDHWPADDLAEASAVFNLMRNLGGAMRLALIDTILDTPHGGALHRFLSRASQAGNGMLRVSSGLPLVQLHNVPIGADRSAMTQAIVKPLVGKGRAGAILQRSMVSC